MKTKIDSLKYGRRNFKKIVYKGNRLRHKFADKSLINCMLGFCNKPILTPPLDTGSDKDNGKIGRHFEILTRCNMIKTGQQSFRSLNEAGSDFKNYELKTSCSTKQHHTLRLDDRNIGKFENGLIMAIRTPVQSGHQSMPDQDSSYYIVTHLIIGEDLNGNLIDYVHDKYEPLYLNCADYN